MEAVAYAAVLAATALLLAATALSVAGQGIVYVGDEARRAVGLGPRITTFEVAVMRPTGDIPTAGDLFCCIRRPSEPGLAAGGIDCLNREYMREIAGFGKLAATNETLDNWIFRVPVDNAPESVCLDFHEQVHFEHGALIVSLLPKTVKKAIRFGSLCLSGVPSPGEVLVEKVTCPSLKIAGPGNCQASEIVMTPTARKTGAPQ